MTRCLTFGLMALVMTGTVGSAFAMDLSILEYRRILAQNQNDTTTANETQGKDASAKREPAQAQDAQGTDVETAVDTAKAVKTETTADRAMRRMRNL